MPEHIAQRSGSKVASPLRVAFNGNRVMGATMASHDQAAAETLSTLRQKFCAAAYSATGSGMDVSGLFGHYDRDHSGEISFEEFRRAVRKDGKLKKQEVQDEALRHVFDIADTDDGGTIGLSEFESLLLGPRSSAESHKVIHSAEMTPTERDELPAAVSPRRTLGAQRWQPGFAAPKLDDLSLRRARQLGVAE